MTEFFCESPIFVGFVGVVVSVLTLFGWIQTGNRWAMYVGGASIVVTILLIWLNLAIKTDREQIRGMLEDTALELEQNRSEALKRRLHPDHSQQVASAMQLLPRLKFRVAQVTKVHSIELSKLGNQQTAQIRMNVYVEIESDLYPGKIPRWVQLDLEKRNDKWLVADFQHKEPTYEFMGRE